MSTPSNELVSYISTGLAAGKTPEALRAELKTVGWADADVDAAFGAPASPSPAAAPIKVKKHLKWWKLAIIVVVAAIVLVVGAGAGYWYLLKTYSVPLSIPAGTLMNIVIGSLQKGHDDATVNDSDFDLASSTIAAGDNAYLDDATLKLAKPSASEKTNTLNQLSGKDVWDQSYIDRVVGQNSQAIAVFLDAVQKPDFQFPNATDPKSFGPTTEVVSFVSLREISRIISLDALTKANKGDTVGGATEALAVAAYGQKIATSQTYLLGFLVGLGIKETGLQTLKKILATGVIGPDAAQGLDQMLGSFSDTAPALVDAIKFDYWNFKNSIEDSIKNPFDESLDTSMAKTAGTYLFEKNKTFNQAADIYRKEIKMAGEACQKFVIPNVDNFDYPSMQGENGLGKSLLPKISSSFAEVLNRRCDDLALVASIRAALAPLINAK